MIDIGADIKSSYDDLVRKQIRSSTHDRNWGSEFGHPCDRYLVAARLHPDMKRLHDIGLQKIFNLGNNIEKIVLRILEDCGYRVDQQQRPFIWEKYQLVIRVDAMLRINGDKIPLEIKSCSPNVFRTVLPMKPIDMLNSKYYWVRMYPGQVVASMLNAEKECAVMLFFDKSTGRLEPKTFWFDEWLDYGTKLLDRLDRVNDYVARKELPPAMQCDNCTGCGFFGTLCLEQDFGEGFDFIDDEAVEKDLNRIEKLKAGKQEYETLYEKIKKMFKGKPTTIIGSKWCIESKKYERTIFEIPDDIKMKFVKKIECWKTNIKKLKEEH